MEPTSPVAQRRSPAVGVFADTAYVLNGRVDELALYKRLLTAEERAWLHNNGQGRAYTDIPAPQLPPDVSLAYTYGDPAHAHAATALGDNQYAYDPNGNQIERDIANDGQYQLLYDAENRVVEVKKDGATIAQFTYDGDGKRVKSVEGGVTILFVGGHYEVKGSEITKYYFAGATRIAMRKYTIPQSMTVEYILGDHLGSTSLTTDSTGTKTSEMRYNPWGEVRYTWTTSLSTTPAYQLTRYTYTGQYSYMDDPTTAGVTEGFGLMFYQARWYDPGLGRFAQADTIIPLESQGVQAWDRYAGMNNNPVRYNDPSGHWVNVAIGAGIGLVAGVALYTLNVARTNNGSLDKWNLGEAALVGATGLVAGALIGTGVGATAGVAALTNAVTLAPGAAAMVSTTVASAGAGIVAGGGGYLASNIVFGNEFDGSDFAIASAVGGATGALGPTYATTNQAATLLGAGANMTQYTLSQIANGESVTPDGLMFSVATGAVGGRIGGGYYNPKNGIYSIDYYDIHPGELPSELAWQTLSGGARVFAGSTATYLPAKKWVTQLIPQ